MSRFLCMRILFPLVASFFLSKSLLFGLLLGWWCFLLPISPPLHLSLVHFCVEGWLDGSIFHFLGQVSPHKGKKLGSGFKSLEGSQKSFAKFFPLQYIFHFSQTSFIVFTFLFYYFILSPSTSSLQWQSQPLETKLIGANFRITNPWF